MNEFLKKKVDMTTVVMVVLVAAAAGYMIKKNMEDSTLAKRTV